MIHRERKARKEWDHNAALERRMFTLCPDDSMHDCVTDLILNLYFIDYRSG